MTPQQAGVLLLTLILIALLLVARRLARLGREISLLREEVIFMRATNEVVDALCDAVLAAQAAQKDSEQALAEAQQRLDAIVAETELTPETEAKVRQVLGNAVVTPPPPPDTPPVEPGDDSPDQ